MDRYGDPTAAPENHTTSHSLALPAGSPAPPGNPLGTAWSLIDPVSATEGRGDHAAPHQLQRGALGAARPVPLRVHMRAQRPRQSPRSPRGTAARARAGTRPRPRPGPPPGPRRAGRRARALTERRAHANRLLEGSTSPRAQRRHGLRHGRAGTPGWVQQVSLTFGLITAQGIRSASVGHRGASSAPSPPGRSRRPTGRRSTGRGPSHREHRRAAPGFHGGSASRRRGPEGRPDGRPRRTASRTYSQASEIIMTSCSCVVFETACNPKNAGNIVLAPWPSVSVYLGHVVPSRSTPARQPDGLGSASPPAQGRTESPRWKDWWVWTFGLGALIAGALQARREGRRVRLHGAAGRHGPRGGGSGQGLREVSGSPRWPPTARLGPQGSWNAAQLSLVDHSKKAAQHIEHRPRRTRRACSRGGARSSRRSTTRPSAARRRRVGRRPPYPLNLPLPLRLPWAWRTLA